MGNNVFFIRIRVVLYFSLMITHGSSIIEEIDHILWKERRNIKEEVLVQIKKLE